MPIWIIFTESFKFSWSSLILFWSVFISCTLFSKSLISIKIFSLKNNRYL
nr:MAG TPA: hypothetical protein [Caudoviricetes sp.]